MAPTYAIACLAFLIFSAAGGSTARILSSTASPNELGQQKGEDDGDGSEGGYPSSGGGYGSNPPTDAGGDGSYPTQPGSGSGPTDHMPTIPDIPGSYPTHSAPGYGSCDFWSSNFGSWPDILSAMSTITSIFGKPGSSMFPSSMTILQALQNSKTDAYSTLLKQASASLLNAYAHKNFQLSPDDVKSLFGAALTSPKAAAAQAFQFARANLSFK